MNTILTIVYESQIDSQFAAKTTVTKEFCDPTFDEIYEALRDMCTSIGFHPDTVYEYFDKEE